jgi:hypothetical protein
VVSQPNFEALARRLFAEWLEDSRFNSMADAMCEASIVEATELLRTVWQMGYAQASQTPEIPELYVVAREINHAAGAPWTDPRTGWYYPPPSPDECVCRTSSCGHRIGLHGPRGRCIVCEQDCWS